MSIPRRHHYIQQAHLGLFADGVGMLFVAAKDGASFATALMDRRGKFEPFPNVGSKLDGRSITDLLDSGDVVIEINNSEFLRAFQQTFDTTTNGLSAFALSVLVSDAGAFVIGDHPLTFVHPGMDFGAYGTPLGGKGCELAFPISKHVCLIGRWQAALDCADRAAAAEQVNVRQAMFAQRHIASAAPSPALDAMAQRYAGLGFTSDVARLPTGDGHYIITRRALLPTARRQAVSGDIKALAAL